MRGKSLNIGKFWKHMFDTVTQLLLCIYKRKKKNLFLIFSQNLFLTATFPTHSFLQDERKNLLSFTSALFRSSREQQTKKIKRKFFFVFNSFLFYLEEKSSKNYAEIEKVWDFPRQRKFKLRGLKKPMTF